MARDSRLNIMVDTPVKERFKFYSDSLGLTESALGSYIIGNWIYQQDLVSKSMLNAMQGTIGDVMAQQMDKLIEIGGVSVESKKEGDFVQLTMNSERAAAPTEGNP